MSSNGVGLGHLTRQLAVAERLPAGWHPTFLTMSYGASLLQAAGHLALFTPHHKALGIDQSEWNLHLEEELALATRYGPVPGTSASRSGVSAGTGAENPRVVSFCGKSESGERRWKVTVPAASSVVMPRRRSQRLGRR